MSGSSSKGAPWEGRAVPPEPAITSLRKGGHMAQQIQQQPAAAKQTTSPLKKSDVLFHLWKTLKLIGSLLRDERVTVIRKVAYLGILGGLLVAVLFPELLGDVLTTVSPAFPLLGLEIPVEGTVDWLVFGLATFSLLRIFPNDIVGEHYDRLFRRK
jgi:hypothetical protein